MARITVTFECVSKISDEDLEYQIYYESQKRRKIICETRNADRGDFYWSQYDIYDAEKHSIVVLSYRTRSDFDDLTKSELIEKLSEFKEELEELTEEYEDIELLDEDEYEDYGFDSEQEYNERLRELDIEMFVCNADVELLEKLIESRNGEAF